ncbi:uncharacterized protein LOC143023514 isoform X1 [Oratosquilla oratoria]|uniref:uncharacterized protein LOC143023514 isoform X1 n=1 Tax=Oratosquilla oratoria TaxID=337810 RepID=UPI003F767D90
MGRPRGSRRRKPRPSMRVKSEANSPVLSPVEDDGRNPTKTHGNLPIPKEGTEDGVEISELGTNASHKEDVKLSAAISSEGKLSPTRTQGQGASPRRRRGKFPPIGASAKDAASCPTSSEQSSQETAVSADAAGDAEGQGDAAAVLEGTNGKRKRKRRRKKKKGASISETGNISEGEDGRNSVATTSSASESISASTTSSNTSSALSSLSSTSASSSMDDPSVSSTATEQGATKKRNKNKKKKRSKKNGEVTKEEETGKQAEGPLKIAEGCVGSRSLEEQTHPVYVNSNTGFGTTIVSSQVQGIKPAPAADPTSLIASAPPTIPVGGPDPTSAYSPAAEPDTTHCSYLGHDQFSTCCPAPTLDPGASTVFVPAPEYEPSSIMESTAVVKQTATITAADSSATLEPTTAADSSATLEHTTAAESTIAAEATTALESSAALETSTALESSTSDEASLTLTTLKCSATEISSPSSSFEPCTGLETSVATDPFTSLPSFDPASRSESLSPTDMFAVPFPEETNVEITKSPASSAPPSGDAEVPAAADSWAGSTCPSDTAELSVQGQNPSPQQEPFSRVTMPSAKDVFEHPEARRALDSVMTDMSEEDTSVVSVTPASAESDNRLAGELWRQDTVDFDNSDVFEDDNCVVVSETQWMKSNSVDGQILENVIPKAEEAEVVATSKNLLEEDVKGLVVHLETLNEDVEPTKGEDDLFMDNLDRMKVLSITESPTKGSREDHDQGVSSSAESSVGDHLRDDSEKAGLPEKISPAEGNIEEQTTPQGAGPEVPHPTEIEEPKQPPTEDVFEVTDLMEKLRLKPESSPEAAAESGVVDPETDAGTGFSNSATNLPDVVKNTSGLVTNLVEEEEAVAVEGGSTSTGDVPEVSPSSQEPSALQKAADPATAEGRPGQSQDTSEAKVDAALAELDSLPEEVCESGDVEEEEEEEEEWSYFRMEPQTHKRAEEEFVSNTMPESDMPEVGGQQEQQQQQDVVEYNNDLAPTHFGGPPMTPEELDAPFGIPQAMDVEHAMPMEAAVAPVMEKSFGLDASPSSPRAGSPPRSVEGFITSVEVNTPEESFATSVSINQSADMFTNPGVEQSGPFSVYVSNSPEPASMDPPTFPAGPPAHLEPSSPTAAASPALGSEVEAPASPKSSAEPTVEIVHAQSLVEVDSPPSPVDAPTAFPSSLDLGADSPAPSHPSDPVQSDSLLADNSFTDEPVTEPITDALVDFASKADIQPREAADSPGAPLTPATPVSPQLDLLDQMEQNEGKIEDQFMSRPFESEFIPGHMPHPMLDPMTQSMHFDEPIPTSVEMESPNDYERDLLAPQMNKSGDYREPVETTTAAQEAIISPKVPDEFSSGLFAPTSPEMASVESPDVVPVESPQVAPVESPEVVLVESLRETPVKSTEEVPVKSPEVAPVKTPETPVGAKKATKGVKATPGKATPGKATPTPGRAANRTTPAREATAKGTPGTTSRATPSRGTPGTTSRGTPGTTPRATPGTTPRATRGTTSTPGTKPTTGKTTTPSRAETSKTAPSKPDVKKSTLSKTTSAKPAPTTTAPKPSTRPTAAPRTTTKPTPKTAPTSKPTTTSRTTTTRPTATKPTPTSRPTTKPTGPGEAKKPTTTRPTPRPTSSTVGTASSRTTTTARRPTTAPRTDGKSATDGPSRSLTARKPMTTKTAVDSKDSKNTTNRILSASRTTSTTKSATATKTSSTTKSIASRTSTTTTSKMNGTTAPSKTRTTTAASKTATKTSSGVGIKKTAVSATAKTTGTKTKITEVAASATEVKMEPILNGENKIVDEETSVEVVEKLEAEKSSITSTEVVEESSITSSQVVEKIICETSSSEQVVTAEQMSTELLVNGDH